MEFGKDSFPISKPVKRLAMLIGNNNWGGEELPGVSQDIDGIRNFLLLPAGGAWADQEILVIVRQIHKEDILQILRYADEEVDYLFIYFCGHGYLIYRDPIFILPGGDEISLSEIKRCVTHLPVLMITDSCQAVPKYSQGGLLSEKKIVNSRIDPIKEFKSRRNFDNLVRNLSPGFFYASAVNPTQTAWENKSGGIYTQSLIRVCHTISNNDMFNKGWYSISTIHSWVALSVRTYTANQQRPYIVINNKNLIPPFLIKS